MNSHDVGAGRKYDIALAVTPFLECFLVLQSKILQPLQGFDSVLIAFAGHFWTQILSGLLCFRAIYMALLHDGFLGHEGRHGLFHFLMNSSDETEGQINHLRREACQGPTCFYVTNLFHYELKRSIT